MLKLALLCLTALSAILISSPARAWGEYGHLTICEVTYRNLTPSAREQLKSILQSDSGGTIVQDRDGVEERRYTRFNVGCLEEDERPRRHPKDHFLNVDRSLVAISDDSCPLSTSTGNELSCIFGGLRRDIAILKDTGKSNADRAFALMAIGHWIGDLHQPLHVSFADDSGGNGIPAKLEGRCGTSRYRVQNMHGLWDNCLLEAGLFERVRQRADFKTTWSRRTIAYRAADTLMANTPLSQEVAFASGEPWQWAAESYVITLSPLTAYCAAQNSVCEAVPFAGPKRIISQHYLADNKAIAEERVARAGFRLAHLINQALDGTYSAPMANGMQPQ